jgi:hypothetical protein
VQDITDPSVSLVVEVVVVEPLGFVVVVVVVVDVPDVVCWGVVCVVCVPLGTGAFASTTKSVGATVEAGTTEVGNAEAGTALDAVASAGVGVPCDPTGTVFDSIERGSLAGKPPM